MDNSLEMAAYLCNSIKKREGFQLVLEVIYLQYHVLWSMYNYTYLPVKHFNYRVELLIKDTRIQHKPPNTFDLNFLYNGQSGLSWSVHYTLCMNNIDSGYHLGGSFVSSSSLCSPACKNWPVHTALIIPQLLLVQWLLIGMLDNAWRGPCKT